MRLPWTADSDPPWAREQITAVFYIFIFPPHHVRRPSKYSRASRFKGYCHHLHSYSFIVGEEGLYFTSLTEHRLALDQVNFCIFLLTVPLSHPIACHHPEPVEACKQQLVFSTAGVLVVITVSTTLVFAQKSINLYSHMYRHNILYSKAVKQFKQCVRWKQSQQYKKFIALCYPHLWWYFHRTQVRSLHNGNIFLVWKSLEWRSVFKRFLTPQILAFQELNHLDFTPETCQKNEKVLILYTLVQGNSCIWNVDFRL